MFGHWAQIWHLCVTYVEGYDTFYVNRDGYHSWGRKCSLFPKHIYIHSLWKVHDFTHSLCTVPNLSVLRPCLCGLMTGLFCLPRLGRIIYITYIYISRPVRDGNTGSFLWILIYKWLQADCSLIFFGCLRARNVLIVDWRILTPFQMAWIYKRIVQIIKRISPTCKTGCKIW